MDLKTIKDMSYTDFIAFIKETNRCPGGKQTIKRIREIIDINEKTKILEIGSNTGFTSLEFVRISKAKIYGIDISEKCVEIANEIKKSDCKEISHRVNFKVASSYDIPYKDEYFDIIMAGGATGFMSRKEKALEEYFRILKNWGFLIITPLVYHTDPPKEIINSINKILGIEITPMNAGDWKNKILAENELWELYHEETKTLSSKTEMEINDYVSYFIQKEHIQNLNNDLQEVIRERWKKHIQVFNENHKYLGFSIQIYRKRKIKEEPEFFV